MAVRRANHYTKQTVAPIVKESGNQRQFLTTEHEVSDSILGLGQVDFPRKSVINISSEFGCLG